MLHSLSPYLPLFFPPLKGKIFFPSPFHGQISRSRASQKSQTNHRGDVQRMSIGCSSLHPNCAVGRRKILHYYSHNIYENVLSTEINDHRVIEILNFLRLIFRHCNGFFEFLRHNTSIYTEKRELEKSFPRSYNMIVSSNFFQFHEIEKITTFDYTEAMELGKMLSGFLVFQWWAVALTGREGGSEKCCSSSKYLSNVGVTDLDRGGERYFDRKIDY